MRFDWMDEYAEFVLCEIKNPKYAERVKDEIVIHLQDLYADLLKQGLDQKAAQALSIQNMGDLKDLQRQYKQASRLYYTKRDCFIDLSKLCFGWLIVLSMYILVFIIFGLYVKYDSAMLLDQFYVTNFVESPHLKHVLGILLIVFPYAFAALYYSFFCKGKSKPFYALGILFPCISEKIFIYLLSAFIYGINPLYVTYVMQNISGIIGDPTAPFFSWGYVLGGVILSLIIIIFLDKSERRTTQKQLL